MKKLLLIITSALMFCAANVKAQITLDTTLNIFFGGLGYDFKLVQIGSSETKWYFCDTLNNTFSLYNMDFTPFITNVTVPEPFAPTTHYMQVLYVTRELFDCDSANIEYAYYSPSNPNRPFRVVRTDGSILFQVDSANGPYSYGTRLGGTDAIRPIINTSDGAKLFLQTGVGLSKFLVYSLCGSLPTDVFDFNEYNQSFVSIFPNPSSGLLIFQINLPDNMNEYELRIFDANVREMERQKINAHTSKYLIDVSHLSGGAYYYVLGTKDNVYQSGKFVLNK